MAVVTAMNRDDLQTPVRNNYFYGKLLDAYHFELETDYLNAKRWLINRRIAGFGVVCGLDVIRGTNDDQIIVASGLALDGWGREIIVPQDTRPLAIPQDIAQRAIDTAEDADDAYVEVMLCYQECKADPVPVLAGDCNGSDECAPGAIREQYRIEFGVGYAKDITTDCIIPDLIVRGQMDYEALARWVTHECVPLPKDPCIPLANVHVSQTTENHCGFKHEDVDIACRPIVYTNRLLFNMLLCVINQGRTNTRQE